MTVEKQLGMRIRYLRSQKKWSQEDLALEADIKEEIVIPLLEY